MRLTMLLAAVFCTNELFAQWKVGVQAGYTHNWLTTSSGYMYDRHYEPAGGFTVGVPVQYGFFDWLAVQGELTYTQKNYDTYRSGFNQGFYDNVSNDYLSVPLYARFSFGGKKVRGFFNAGFYAGGWLSGRREGTMASMFEEGDDNLDGTIGGFTGFYKYKEKTEFDSRRDNRFEAGALAGAGIQYQITRLIQVFAEGRFYYSFTDMQKKYMSGLVPRYNNTLVCHVGIMFTLGK